jgi:hypothetical protein
MTELQEQYKYLTVTIFLNKRAGGMAQVVRVTA